MGQPSNRIPRTPPITLPPPLPSSSVNSKVIQTPPDLLIIMAESEVKQIIQQFDNLKSNTINQAPQLLSRAKLGLLKLNASYQHQRHHLNISSSRQQCSNMARSAAYG